MNSIKSRVILGIIASTASVLIVVGIVFSYIASNFITNQYHDELQVHVDELAKLAARDQSGRVFIERELSDARFAKPNSGFYWQLSEGDEVHSRSESLNGSTLTGAAAVSTKKQFRETEGPNGPVLEYGFQFSPDGRSSISASIATDLKVIEDSVMEFQRDIGLAILTIAVLAGLIGYAQLRFSLSPIDNMLHSIERVRKGQAERIEGAFPAEVEPLANELNRLIEQHRTTVEKARTQAAKLAHGLRTPMAVMLSEIESSSDSPANRSRSVLLAEHKRIMDQINHHLSRARLLSVSRGTNYAAPIGRIATDFSAAIIKMRDRHDLEVICEGDPELAIAIDPVDFSELFATLFDNAAKWAGNQITVSWTERGESAVITIENDLHPLRAQDPELKETGLGIEIAEEIATEYGGLVEAMSGPGLFRMTVTLPLAANN